MGWRLLHWGPILALTVISVISTCTIMCILDWWPPLETFWGAVHFSVYSFWLSATLYNFFAATFEGPGHVPNGWIPTIEPNKKFLQYCNTCEGYKAPRSHHCRKCGSCVMKMDHHCPWINNCVGHRNHAHFTQFLFFAPIGCIQSLCILIPSMYRAVHRHYYLYYGDGTEPIVNLGVNGFVACMFACGLAVGVTIAVGGLFFIQLRSILKNETGIESWIIEKARYRDRAEDEPPFVYPYNLGWWQNFKMVIHLKPRPELDGLWWPVLEDCHQYTLTIEQIMQKQEKKERSVMYTIREAYSGAIFPITKGCRICCCPPCTDEPRIGLAKGDTVLVSRWKKHWLYGDMQLDANGVKVERVRGWFPRRCAVEVVGRDTEISADSNNHLPNHEQGDIGNVHHRHEKSNKQD